MTDERPWWASDAGASPALDDADPIEAHRAARRRANGDGIDGGDGIDRGDGGDAASPPPGAGDAPGGSEDPRSAPGPGAATHSPEICGVCPICIGLRALGESRPELVAHLTEAARHLAAAVRAVVEPPPDRGAPGFERIDLDRSTRPEGEAAEQDRPGHPPRHPPGDEPSGDEQR